MSLFDQYRELDDREKKRFQETIQKLQRQSFVLRGERFAVNLATGFWKNMRI